MPSIRLFRLAAPLLGLLLLVLPLHAQDTPVLDHARAVHDSLRAVWADSDGLEHALLTEQLGVWIADPDYTPPNGWDDRTEALYDLSMLHARRFDANPPSTLNTATETTPVHWSKALRTLRRAQLREEFDSLLDSYFMAWPVLPAVQALANGDLAMRRHQPDSAKAFYDEAFRSSPHPRLSGEALLGMSRALYDLRRYDEAVDTLAHHLDEGAFSADALTQLGWSLIRLGRVREATGLFQLALEVNPLHERAHYMLGNGYARYNYTELERVAPVCFPDSAQAERLALAREHLRAGRTAQARALLDALALEGPDLVEPRTMLAELAWLDGAYPTAERLLREALTACPDYGRAHAVMAKVLEMRRLEQSARRADYRDSLRDAAMPTVAGIDTFIANWHALTPEIQKQVALAVHPWRAFVPALNAAGQTHYIKPVYERLSQAPHMEALEDARINLDSRLWDDVRGVGGFHSVTGIEDVRRVPWGGPNTLLHELNHQVHGIFTPVQKQRVEELYREAKTRQADGDDPFMSRYQGSTVWEYFSEGVHAYTSPAIDEWDEREVVLERLLERDMALFGFIQSILAVQDVSENTAVARTNGALRHLQYGHADSSWQALQAIDEQWVTRPFVLDARQYVATLLDRDDDAIAAAWSQVQLYPEDGDGWTGLASALEFSDSATVAGASLPDSLDTPLEVLTEGLNRARRDDLPAIRLAHGRQLYLAQRYRKAEDDYEAALAFNPGDPYAIWGRAVSRAASALQDEGTVYDDRFDAAVGDFEEAVKERSGVVELRLDYARALLRAGRLDAADTQLREAELLQPDSPSVKAYRGWYHHATGDTAARDAAIAAALEGENPPDEAVVLAQAFGMTDARPLSALLADWERRGPRYIYNPAQYRYEVREVVEPWMRLL